MGVGSKFSVLAPLSCSFASDFAKTRNCHKINVPTCADGHLRLKRILPDGRARNPGTAARLITQARVKTQNELAGKAAR